MFMNEAPAPSTVKQAAVLGLLAEHAPDGLLLVSPEGRVLYANAAIERMFGYTRAELEGGPLERLLPHGHGDAHAAARAAYLAAPEPRVMAPDRQIAGRRRDGTLIAVHVHLGPVEIDGVVHQLAAVRDVDRERRRSEDAHRAQRLDEEAALARIVGDARLPVTAQSFGAAPLREGSPEAFAELVNMYGDALDAALEQRAYRVDGERGVAIRALVERLGFLWARPRDLVEIHSAAVDLRARASAAAKAGAYAEEGRLLLLEIMGSLCTHYRKLSLGRGT